MTPQSDQRHVPVLINLPLDMLDMQLLDEIRSVDHRIAVMPAYHGTGTDAKPVEGLELEAALARTQVAFGFSFPLDWLDKAPHLKWVQLASAGADHVLREGLLARRPDLLLTTASGIHEVPISEYILAVILFFSRGFDKAVRNQIEHRWERYQPTEAHSRTVGMIGYGPIARRTAGLCKALGMEVIAVRASIRAQQPGDGPVSRFYPAGDLDEVLAQSDYVVLAAPRTPQTEGMIGAAQLATMKKSAVLVNISRGALVDEPALIDALRSGEIAAAGLDVTVEEPLPETSPLWSMPNVLITPHNAGANPNYAQRATALFCDNLRRYLAGEQLHNLVDAARGY